MFFFFINTLYAIDLLKNANAYSPDSLKNANAYSSEPFEIACAAPSNIRLFEIRLCSSFKLHSFEIVSTMTLWLSLTSELAGSSRDQLANIQTPNTRNHQVSTAGLIIDLLRQLFQSPEITKSINTKFQFL